MLTFFEEERPRYGIGGTHHLAFETQDRDTLQWKRWLTDSGIPVTGPYRVYFESIYFTDPDGLILEIATRGPAGRSTRLPGLGFSGQAAAAGDDGQPSRRGGHCRSDLADPVSGPTREMRLRRMHHITAIGGRGTDRTVLRRYPGHATGETDGQLRRSELAASLFRRR